MDIDSIIKVAWYWFLNSQDTGLRVVYGDFYCYLMNRYGKGVTGDEWWQSSEERLRFINEG